MKVLVDTPVWSYALRLFNKQYQAEIDELAFLIQEQRALIIGPIRQEILSGYSDMRKYKQIRDKLSNFENTTILDIDYERAAEFCNECRMKGIQGSHTDFLICAVAQRNDVSIFTTDNDFSLYKGVLPIKLHSVIKARGQ